ncbi:hypothetical protein N2152v2_007915 [Parachlorella kessleri]
MVLGLGKPGLLPGRRVQAGALKGAAGSSQAGASSSSLRAGADSGAVSGPAGGLVAPLSGPSPLLGPILEASFSHLEAAQQQQQQDQPAQQQGQGQECTMPATRLPSGAYEQLPARSGTSCAVTMCPAADELTTPADAVPDQSPTPPPIYSGPTPGSPSAAPGAVSSQQAAQALNGRSTRVGQQAAALRRKLRAAGKVQPSPPASGSNQARWQGYQQQQQEQKQEDEPHEVTTTLGGSLKYEEDGEVRAAASALPQASQQEEQQQPEQQQQQQSGERLQQQQPEEQQRRQQPVVQGASEEPVPHMESHSRRGKRRRQSFEVAESPAAAASAPAKRGRGGKRGGRRSSIGGGDLIGRIVEVPSAVFSVDIPSLYYRGVVTKRESGRKQDAYELKFLDDNSKYWFPTVDIRSWLADMEARGAEGKQSGSGIAVGKATDEFAAEVLTGIASGSSLRSGRGNSQLSDAAVAAAARDDAACAEKSLETVGEEKEMGSAQPVGRPEGEHQQRQLGREDGEQRQQQSDRKEDVQQQQQGQQQERDPIGGDHQDESQGDATASGHGKAGGSSEAGKERQKGEAPGLKTRRSSGALHIMADAAGMNKLLSPPRPSS